MNKEQQLLNMIFMDAGVTNENDAEFIAKMDTLYIKLHYILQQH